MTKQQLIDALEDMFIKDKFDEARVEHLIDEYVLSEQLDELERIDSLNGLYEYEDGSRVTVAARIAQLKSRRAGIGEKDG